MNKYEWKLEDGRYNYYKNGELFGYSDGFTIESDKPWEPDLWFHWAQVSEGETFGERWLDKYVAEDYGLPSELIAEGEEELTAKYEEFVAEAKEAFGNEFVDDVIEYEGSVPEALRGLREGYYFVNHRHL